MRYSPELSQPELPRLGDALKKAGSLALAGVLVAGGAGVAAAYHDLRQGVDGSVFDIHHAETHALDTQGITGDQASTAGPAQFDLTNLPSATS
ncbi:MAG TPA: hypothetical protein VJ843_02585 [Candidatus Saccharimonadales bacterium]|nr:hypothetical protein [Candidatus Saccharimonadales bacterium]